MPLVRMQSAEWYELLTDPDVYAGFEFEQPDYVVSVLLKRGRECRITVWHTGAMREWWSIDNAANPGE